MCAAALFELKQLLLADAAEAGPLALGGTPEGDFYQLANLLAELVLLDAGWEVVNLGPHTPLSSFGKALVELRPRLLWISISDLHEPERFLAEYAGLYRRAEQNSVAIAVGGRGLVEPLRARMSYTTFGDRLEHLKAFAQSLHPRPKLPRRGRPPLVRR
jgi:hypothetical protein